MGPQYQYVACCWIIIMAAPHCVGQTWACSSMGLPLQLPLPAYHQDQTTLGLRHGPSALEQQQ